MNMLETEVEGRGARVERRGVASAVFFGVFIVIGALLTLALMFLGRDLVELQAQEDPAA